MGHGPTDPRPGHLLTKVQSLVLQELAGCEPMRIALRLDDDGERSVRVVVQLLATDSIMVARVYESDLWTGARTALNPHYFSVQDATLLVEALAGLRPPRP